VKRKLMFGDCLERMKEIPDNSVDMCLTDPPYGTTACKWDTVIPFEPTWEQLKRITKDNGAICLFGSEPFSSHLRLSNLKMFKYDWIWQKTKGGGFALANKQPLKRHEFISVFYRKQCVYNPQKTKAPKHLIDKRKTINNSKSISKAIPLKHSKNFAQRLGIWFHHLFFLHTLSLELLLK
jgi:site-specific DNA-methyltransferase (adenine-specific)